MIEAGESLWNSGVGVGVGGTGVKVIEAVGIGISVGVEIDNGTQETRTIERMTVSNVFAFMFSLVFRLENKAPND